MRSRFICTLLVLCPLSFACSEPDPQVEDSPDAGGVAGRDAGRTRDAGTPDTGYTPATCTEATGAGTEPTNEVRDGTEACTVTVTAPSACLRSYTLQTNAVLRDNLPANPRVVNEQAKWPTVRTRNNMFDALYALALDEVRENSVSEIRDGAFNDGNGVPCGEGGCFETGRKWNYVWTRDTAYSVDLGLAPLDPARARNSLEFKLSERRTGGNLQIVQDTGTGGSYPISTDRVAEALAAARLLEYLDGTERAQFREKAYEAIKNTLEHDRKVAYDAEDGLYRGETSFLDWREQTYPDWTKEDPVQIGVSKSLSTNVLHLRAMQIAAALAAEGNDTVARDRYLGWANELKAKIHQKFWLASDKLYSAYLTTTLDPSPVHRYDLLGEALAVLSGVADEATAREVLANYPHTGKGPSVIWPQQQGTPIYHNRAFWPFVTAYWLKAARQARNDAVANHAVQSLMRGAALNLSNMENFELVTGRSCKEEDGKGCDDWTGMSGPRINSQRQLWSVAGYLSIGHDGGFGVTGNGGELSFSPYITREQRHTLFANADTLVLNSFPFRGRYLNVVISLPAKGSSRAGAYQVSKVTVNGTEVSGAIPASSLQTENKVEIVLSETAETASSMRQVANTDADYKLLYGPKTPAVSAIAVQDGKLKLTLSRGAEVAAAADLAFNVYRNGAQVAAGLPGTTETWVDETSTDFASQTFCYSVETYFVGSKNHSQHARPLCYWDANYERIQSYQAYDFASQGGEPIVEHGRFHYQNWGDPGHSLTLSNVKPHQTGRHLLQLVAGNGDVINTSISCAVKKVTVQEVGGAVAGEGYVAMPTLANWSIWKDSSTLAVNLEAGKAYEVKIWDDPFAVNMSVFRHFETFSGVGGKGGSFSRVNVGEVKLLPFEGVDSGGKIALNGVGDFDKFPEGNRVLPGIMTPGEGIDWERFALDWDDQNLYVAIVSKGFETANVPYLLYVEAVRADEQFAAAGSRPGLTYFETTGNAPFQANYLVAVRQQSAIPVADKPIDSAPWNGVFRYDGGWVRQYRFVPHQVTTPATAAPSGANLWVSEDKHTIAFRLRWGQLGKPASIRIAGHMVRTNDSFNVVVPDHHKPWLATATGGYYQISLAGESAAVNWTRASSR